MTDDRLFDIDSVPEVPLIRPARRSRGEFDARFRNDYPPRWDRCTRCAGTGWVALPSTAMAGRVRTATRAGVLPDGAQYVNGDMFLEGVCPDCLGMGSEKRKARLLAGFRCERCLHPYLGKGDMTQLGKPWLASNHHWSPCDVQCLHGGPLAFESGVPIMGYGDIDAGVLVRRLDEPGEVLAEWRILTVHHLDGDKANLAWWNLAVLCQRCHLEIQAKVVMERVYPHEHSPWFKPHAAGYYAKVYLDEDVTREEALARMDELLALEAA